MMTDCYITFEVYEESAVVVQGGLAFHGVTSEIEEIIDPGDGQTLAVMTATDDPPGSTLEVLDSLGVSYRVIGGRCYRDPKNIGRILAIAGALGLLFSIAR
jgi:hypothetical protein